ncbi:hypothetical protein A2110_00170 [Candidatus Jorgensenbacteria bacterium GWA1_54_12]|uniref:Elongation factor P C-terminal domain-containing protein n=1 Tax=Candidatus Jorgensenbacteria bacterium GWA1_54_12 TaxID=1798468 RepID=A0A1F6BKX3_9BACT|nr:MAG: hypothetical protein A2110_00170 [Candidatus Jorgensenbacteria bacterium GWA1_54_12]
MLSFNELKPGVSFIIDGEPYVVVEYNFIRKQQGRPIAQLILRNLITGKTKEHRAHQSDTYTEAEIGTSQAIFVYAKAQTGEYWFKDAANPSVRFALKKDVLGNAVQYLIPNLEVTVVTFEDKPTAVRLPIKMDLTVTEAPPRIKGNTASGGNKTVTTETGLKVTVPLFVEAGDVIRVNTDTGTYTERV